MMNQNLKEKLNQKLPLEVIPLVIKQLSAIPSKDEDENFKKSTLSQRLKCRLWEITEVFKIQDQPFSIYQEKHPSGYNSAIKSIQKAINDYKIYID